jgi:glycosyltransferase involved in cell wall biosynthesis
VRKISGLWVSNAPWAPTGYGTQTKQVLSRMNGDGHNMAVAANYGLEATQTNIDGIEVFPKGTDPYSNDVIYPYFMDWQRQHPDGAPFVFTLYDAWVFQGAKWDEMPVVSWVPIDHTPVPPKVAEFLTKDNVRPVAMSRFGADQMKRAGIACDYVPHAIDTFMMKPTSHYYTGDGAKSGRQIIKAPRDAFVVGIINANKGTAPVRKAFAEQILAFSIFAADKPDAVLYLHTERHGAYGGISLDAIIKAVGLRDDQYIFVNQYQNMIGIPDEAMAAIYTALNVLLAPTLGEGFGITVIEAQACGVPVIVSDFSAQPELVGDGWKVPGQPLWDAAQSAWFQIPSVEAIVNSLHEAYERKSEKTSKDARQFIVDNYDADTVYKNMWCPLFADLVKE